jgi:predicted lipase
VADITGYVGVAGPTAVVAVKGTNTDSLKSLLNDVKFNKDHLDDVEVEIDGDKVDAFPNAGDAEAHKGFLEVFERIQPDMHPAIQTAFSMNATRILVVGHSLGASVGLLLAVYLQEQFPNVTVSARTFGAPRTGDGDFADYVDQTMGNRSLFMVNYDDMVPHLPPKALNFVHSSGEVWSKRNDSDWVWCRGQDNDDCSDSVDGDFSSLHDGPYAQVYMDCTQMKGKASSTAPQLKTFNWTDTGLSNSGQ